MKFRTLSEAKAELGTLVRLAERGETVVISRHGKPSVRLAPVREDDFRLTTREAGKLDAWLQAERDAGRTRSYSSIEEMLKKSRTRGNKRRS